MSVSRPVGVWILAVALCCFAAGLVAGVAVPELLAAPRASEGPEDYARNLADTYALSDEQHRQLLMVLKEGERRELQILKSADWSQLPPALRAARLEANDDALGKPGTLSVHLDERRVLRMPLNLRAVLQLDDGTAYVGFTGATGAAYQEHSIVAWHFNESRKAP